MKVVQLNSWEEFEREVASEQENLEKLKMTDSWRFIPPLLFRGQKDSQWKLETTLERFIREREVEKIMCLGKTIMKF